MHAVFQVSHKEEGGGGGPCSHYFFIYVTCRASMCVGVSYMSVHAHMGV